MSLFIRTQSFPKKFESPDNELVSQVENEVGGNCLLAMYAKSLTSATELTIVWSKHDLIIFFLLLRGFEANSVSLVTFGIIRAVGRFHFHATKNKSKTILWRN